MPLTRFKLSAIEDGGIATADLADGSVTTAKIADSAVTSVKTSNLFTNTEIAGTEAARMPVGTTAQRANAQSGDIRFNSSISLMEYYDGSGWKSIDSAPIVSSISPTVETDASANITITGSFFATGVTVKFVGNDGTEYASPSVTRNSANEIVATTPATALSVANEPYDVVVTNVSGLSGTLSDALDAGGVPAFNESAGSLGSVYYSGRTGLSFDAGATDPDGDTITYSISVGSLPSGLSLNTSTGEISGTADAVGSDTTTTFTVSAATASDTSTRQFSITIAAPIVTSYTSTGSGTFSVPSGISAVDVLVVAGGGGGGARGGGGGGAGGLIYRPAFPVTPSGSVSYSVGTGGRRATHVDSSDTVGAENGTDSTFGTLTAKGGGHGGNQSGNPVGPTPNGGAGSGGSGGGSHQNVYYTPGQNNPMPNNATQPQQPGDSGTYGFGNQGGSNSNPSSGHGAAYSALAGGGGGAGQAGTPGNTSGPTMGKGGDGKSYDISGSSVTYAGGGGAGHHPPFPSQLSYSQGGSGGGGNGAPFPAPAGGSSGQNGTANRGGGGGGGTTDGNSGTHYGGTGGSGVVIVAY